MAEFPQCTVWKFEDFSPTRTFREITFWGSRTSKSAIFAVLEPLNFEFGQFFVLQNCKDFQNSKLRLSKIAKMAVFDVL